MSFCAARLPAIEAVFEPASAGAVKEEKGKAGSRRAGNRADRITEAAGILCVCDVDTRRNCPGHHAARCTRQESTIAERDRAKGRKERERELSRGETGSTLVYRAEHYLRQRLRDLRFAGQLRDYWQENTNDAFRWLIARRFQDTRVPPTSNRVIDIWKPVERLFPRYCV